MLFVRNLIERDDWMEFKDVLVREHATRKFTDQRVSEKTIVKVLEEAQRTPPCLIRNLGEYT